MEGQPKTSFIPKKPIQVSNKVPVGGSTGRRNKKGGSIFYVISLIIFLLSLAALGGVYFWKYSLEQTIEGQVKSLEQVRNEFDENFVQSATRLNQRIVNAAKLLDNHLSPSTLFALLEEYTLQSVAFSNFVFADTKDGQIQVGGTGSALQFESIVLQSDAFGRTGVLRNVLFTDLQPELESNSVSFTFSATLDPRLVLFRNSLSENFNNSGN